MWCHCKKPAKPYPPISVESVGIVWWDASGTQTFQAQDSPYYASFSIEVLPADATNKMVTITSSNTRVINWATYDSSDVTFTIEWEWEAEVTITSQSNPEVSTTYSVTVTPAAEPFEPNNSMYLIQTRNTKKTRSAWDVDATVRFFAEDENSTDYVQAQFWNNNKLTYVSYHWACEWNEYCEEIFNNEDIKTELWAAIGWYIAEHGIPAAWVLQFSPEVRDTIEDVFNETWEVSDITTAIEEAQDVVKPSIITITIVHNASNIWELTNDMWDPYTLPYTFTVPEPVTIDDNLDWGHELSVYGVDSWDDYGSFFPEPNVDWTCDIWWHFATWACNGLVMSWPVDVYEDATLVAAWNDVDCAQITFTADGDWSVSINEITVEPGVEILDSVEWLEIQGTVITATPDEWCVFSGWTLNNGDPLPQTVTGDLDIVAHFELECDVCDDQCPDFDPCECDPCSDPDCPHFDIVDCGCVWHINNNPFDSQTVEISLGGNATYQFIPDFNSAVCTEPYGLYTSSSDIRVAEPSLSWDWEYSTLLIEAIGPWTCTIYLSDDDGRWNTYQLNVTVPQEATGDIQFYAIDKNGDPFVIMAPTEEDSSKAIWYVFCKLTDGASENNVNVYYDGPVQDVQVTFGENLDYDEHKAESESESWEYIIIVDWNWSDIEDAYWSDWDAGSIVVELNNEEYATIPLISCNKFLYMTDFDCSTTPTTEIYFSISDNEEPDGVILNPDGEWWYRGMMTTPTMNWLFEKYVSEGNQMNLSAMIVASMHWDSCWQWNFNLDFIERLWYLMARDTAEEREHMANFLEHFWEDGNLLDSRGGE